MLKISRLAGQAFFRINLHPQLQPNGFPVASRLVSTNAAINRGIRKSTRAVSRDDPRSRHDQPRGRPPFEERASLSAERRGPSRQQQQHDNNMRGLGRPMEGRISPREQRYLQEKREESTASHGRYPPSRNSNRYPKREGGYSNSARSTPGGWNDRSSFEDTEHAVGDRRERPRSVGSHGATRSSSHASKTSDLPNRAARRASIYGHYENPPPEFKFPNDRRNDDYGNFVRSPRSRDPPALQRSAFSDDRQPKIGYNPPDSMRSRATDRFPIDSPGSYRQRNSSFKLGNSASKDYNRRSTGRQEQSYRRDRENSGSSYASTSGLSGESERDSIQPEEDRRRPEWKVRAPLSIPYTTPASEFLYGTSVITAALKSQRRKMYNLYLYNGENRENVAQDTAIRKLALSQGVEVTKVQGDWLRLMDKMSAGRPHNGYILEASPLPKLPVVAFEPVPTQQAPFHITLGHQSREEEAINGSQPRIEYEVGFPRFPFVLLLDGILDPGNLGAIMRTAYFLGIDAVAISNRNSAPFTPITLKASAGASENLPLLSISQPGSFIDECQKHGWKFYAAVAPGNNPSGGAPFRKPYYSTSTLNCPPRDHPCVLILGGEGEGLRWNIQKKADYAVGIEGYRAGQGGVDSLNVSVAAGLLCEAFMRPARHVSSSSGRRRDSVSSDPAPNVLDAVNTTFDNNSSQRGGNSDDHGYKIPCTVVPLYNSMHCA